MISFHVTILEVWLAGLVLLTASAEFPDSFHLKNIDLIPKTIEYIYSSIKKVNPQHKVISLFEMTHLFKWHFSVLAVPPSPFLPFLLSTFGSRPRPRGYDICPQTKEPQSIKRVAGRRELFKLMGSDDTWAGHGWLAGSWQRAVCPEVRPAAWGLCGTPTVLSGRPQLGSCIGKANWAERAPQPGLWFLTFNYLLSLSCGHGENGITSHTV